METIDITDIAVTAATILGSASAWTFYSRKMELKAQETKEDKREKSLYRDDLKERVTILETKLEEERQQANKYQQDLVSLTTKVTEYKVRLEFLERENNTLKAKFQ